jgi:hypothetical protein
LVLTRNEVIGIAAGSAQGQSFLGTYQMDLATQTGCDCRSGTCADFRRDGGIFLALEQDNGSLTLNGVRGSWRGLPCVGGVDADGSFSCGNAMADSLYLMRGHLSLGDGQTTSMSLEEDEIVRETDQNGLMFDCDIHLTAAAHRIQ